MVPLCILSNLYYISTVHSTGNNVNRSEYVVCNLFATTIQPYHVRAVVGGVFPLCHEARATSAGEDKAVRCRERTGR